MVVAYRYVRTYAYEKVCIVRTACSEVQVQKRSSSHHSSLYSFDLSVSAVNMNTILSNLPDDLILELILNWGVRYSVKTVYSLDIFFQSCEQPRLMFFRGILSSPGFVITDYELYTDNLPEDFIDWCLERELKFSVFAFGYETYATAETLTRFFELTGPTLRSFVMHSGFGMNDAAWLIGLAENCPVLGELEVKKGRQTDENFPRLLDEALLQLGFTPDAMHKILDIEYERGDEKKEEGNSIKKIKRGRPTNTRILTFF